MRPFSNRTTPSTVTVFDVVTNSAMIGLVGAQGLEPWTR
jgi:ABC-type methionine transport system permease subunit